MFVKDRDQAARGPVLKNTQITTHMQTLTLTHAHTHHYSFSLCLPSHIAHPPFLFLPLSHPDSSHRAAKDTTITDYVNITEVKNKHTHTQTQTHNRSSWYCLH